MWTFLGKDLQSLEISNKKIDESSEELKSRFTILSKHPFEMKKKKQKPRRLSVGSACSCGDTEPLVSFLLHPKQFLKSPVCYSKRAVQVKTLEPGTLESKY